MNLLDEFSKSYSGTYVQIKHNGSKLPFFVVEVSNSTGTVLGSILSGPSGMWAPHSVKFSIDKFDLDIPHMGLINIPKHGAKRAFLYSQIPERQWKKGVSGKTLRISALGTGGGIDTNDPVAIWNLYNPQYYKLQDFDLKKDVSMALNPHIGVYNNGNEDVLVSFNETTVGYVHMGEIVLVRAFSYLENKVRKLTYCKVE